MVELDCYAHRFSLALVRSRASSDSGVEVGVVSLHRVGALAVAFSLHAGNVTATSSAIIFGLI
jgi:hypothetical protein